MIRFEGFAFRQSDKGPIIASFVAPSHSIDEWAKVPTRLSNRQNHFQRAAIPKHVLEIKGFFEKDDSKTNSSPTSILIGVDPSALSKVKLVNSTGVEINYSKVARDPQSCTVSIEYLPWDSSEFDGDLVKEIDDLFPRVRLIYLQMCSATEEEDVFTAEGEDDSAEQLEAEAEETIVEVASEEDEGEAETAEDVSSREIQDYFAQVSPEEIIRVYDDKEYRDWPQAKQQFLIGLLKDELKPCLIIDGQHRVKGTSSLRDVPFIVAMLPNADWAELAFQFIVNNSSAQKVDENLLFGIVGQSLSAEQLEKTETRLNKSGIKVSLIKAAMRVQLESNPFIGMLKTNTPGEKGFLDATAMQKKVIELWYGSRGRTGTRPRFKAFKALDRRQWSMGDIFEGVCSGSTTQERALDWQERHWFTYFAAFWKAVQQRFEGRLWPATEADWLPINTNIGAYTPQQKETQKLMRATVLGLLQVALLQAWADHRSNELDLQDKKFKDVKIDPVGFKDEVKRYLDRMPDDFFTALTTTGFDASKQTRERLLKNMLAIFERQTSMAKLKEDDPFYASGA
jgi:hypothetical protein